ncbi:hypothetical protein ANO14919_093470 [Xylariales sp. No.14919]|nr:hypothetical protein ANO14919_093470 [Xylariales sp. No.14919]
MSKHEWNAARFNNLLELSSNICHKELPIRTIRRLFAHLEEFRVEPKPGIEDRMTLQMQTMVLGYDYPLSGTALG